MSIRYAAFLLFVLASNAMAEVVQVTPSGFLIKHEVNVSAPSSKVYDALVGKVSSWWNSEHTYSGDSKNLSIEARPGGCFCEQLPNGGGVEHMRVIYVQPGTLVRLSGALGPMQGSGLAGSLTWKMVSFNGGTKLGLNYSVGGYLEGGFEKMAPVANGMLGEQVQRLKAFLETGNPGSDTTKLANP